MNTYPLWKIVCIIMTWFNPIFLAFFVRSKYLVVLLGGCSFTLFTYLEMTYSCLTLGYPCNTNDIELSAYYNIFIGIIYSIIVLVLVKIAVPSK
jgi:hypothetical protein